MTPRKDGVLLMSGKISPDRPLDDYRDAVIQATSNALTAAQNTLAEGEKIVQILSLTVYLNATPDYTTHAKVGDIASGWLYEQLGDAGIGARAAIGLATLPGDADCGCRRITVKLPVDTKTSHLSLDRWEVCFIQNKISGCAPVSSDSAGRRWSEASGTGHPWNCRTCRGPGWGS